MEGGFQLPNSNFGPMLGASFAGSGMGVASFSSYPFEFEQDGETTAKIVNCRLACGSFEITCPDQEIEFTTRGYCYIYVRIDHSKFPGTDKDPAMTVEVASSVPQTTVRYSIRTLYSCYRCAVLTDYRWMPVIVAAI